MSPVPLLPLLYCLQGPTVGRVGTAKGVQTPGAQAAAAAIDASKVRVRRDLVSPLRQFWWLSVTPSACQREADTYMLCRMAIFPLPSRVILVSVCLAKPAAEFNPRARSLCLRSASERRRWRQRRRACLRRTQRRSPGARLQSKEWHSAPHRALVFCNRGGNGCLSCSLEGIGCAIDVPVLVLVDALDFDKLLVKIPL